MVQLFSLSFRSTSAQIQSLMARYDQLPRYIAKKHLRASMRRAVRPYVKDLKKATPKGRKRYGRTDFKRSERGRFQAGGGKRKNLAGALRRAATVKVGWKGKNKDGFAYGVLGYKYGSESMKAIYLEYGTKSITPRRIVAGLMDSIRPAVMKRLKSEMALALPAAVRELKKGKNPGVGRSGAGPGR